MMAAAENLVLDHLGHMRGQFDRMEHRLEDAIACLSHVERAAADHSVALAEINTNLDRLDARVTDIEKRLELVEGSHPSP
jgi:archaellum component FlaC